MKPVYKYSLDGRFIKAYSSAAEAARKEKIKAQEIGEVCLGKRDTYRGFIWSHEKKKSVQPVEIKTPNPTGKNGNACSGKPLSLCNYCSNACSKCSWSRSLIPVKDWKADKVTYRTGDHGRNGVSYIVHECPEFEKAD